MFDFFRNAPALLGAFDSSVEPRNELRGAGALPLHAQLQCSEAAHTEPGFHAAHHAAEVRALVSQPLDPFFVAGGQDAAQQVRVPAEVFRAAVHDHVRALRERVLQAWWGKRAVNDEIRPAAVRFGRVGSDVAGLAGGVFGGLEVYDVTRLEVFGEAI